MKKTISADTKATVVLKALKEVESLATIGSTYDVHPVQIGQWTKKVKELLPTLFTKDDHGHTRIKELEEKVDELHRIIGTRDEELAWLQKKITRASV
jgi:transposase-like protein